MKVFSIKFLLPVLMLLLSYSCKWHRPDNADAIFQPDTVFRVRHAKLFKIGSVEGHRAAIVLDPWDSTRVWARYIIVTHNENYQAPEGYIAVSQPIRSVATSSSTLFSHLQGLGCLNLLAGVTDTAYVVNPLVKLRIRKGLVTEIGVGNQIFDEQLIATDPDVAFFSLFPGLNFDKFNKVGIEVLPLADYLESTPLGRAEWIKFSGLILGKEKETDSIFNEIESNYLKIKSIAQKAKTRPRIVDGLMEGGTWYVSAAQSYMACLYSDAGLDYVFNDKNGTGSIPLGFEEVLNRAREAEYWRILKGGPGLSNRNELLQLDSRYRLLNVFHNGKILFCNVSKVPVYEEGNTRPDLLLADLLYLTHPELNPEYQPVYYQLLP
ncbi:MAG: ABC transporter substrate-binding protein [Bacteroidales bacterium]|jgi:iron complex transport system substrate-binding protein|nr:ABC transporter substrate-binding protein [Bacteroidales bacterium]